MPAGAFFRSNRLCFSGLIKPAFFQKGGCGWVSTSQKGGVGRGRWVGGTATFIQANLHSEVDRPSKSERAHAADASPPAKYSRLELPNGPTHRSRAASEQARVTNSSAPSGAERARVTNSSAPASPCGLERPIRVHQQGRSGLSGRFERLSEVLSIHEKRIIQIVL